MREPEPNETELCPDCNGTGEGMKGLDCATCTGSGGLPPDKLLPCGVCEGSGEVNQSCSCSGNSPQYRCNRCGDAGILVRRCPKCDGEGTVTAEEYETADSFDFSGGEA